MKTTLCICILIFFAIGAQSQTDNQLSNYVILSKEKNDSWLSAMQQNKDKISLRGYFQTYIDWSSQGIFLPDSSYQILIPMFREARLRTETMQLIRDRDLLYADKDGACHCGKCTKQGIERIFTRNDLSLNLYF